MKLNKYTFVRTKKLYFFIASHKMRILIEYMFFNAFVIFILCVSLFFYTFFLLVWQIFHFWEEEITVHRANFREVLDIRRRLKAFEMLRCIEILLDFDFHLKNLCFVRNFRKLNYQKIWTWGNYVQFKI